MRLILVCAISLLLAEALAKNLGLTNKTKKKQESAFDVILSKDNFKTSLLQKPHGYQTSIGIHHKKKYVSKVKTMSSLLKSKNGQHINSYIPPPPDLGPLELKKLEANFHQPRIPPPPKLDPHPGNAYLGKQQVTVDHKFRTVSVRKPEKPIPTPQKFESYVGKPNLIKDSSTAVRKFGGNALIQNEMSIPPAPTFGSHRGDAYLVKSSGTSDQKFGTNKLIRHEKQIDLLQKISSYRREANHIMDPVIVDYKSGRYSLIKFRKPFPTSSKLNQRIGGTPHARSQVTLGHTFRNDTLIQPQQSIPPSNKFGLYFENAHQSKAPVVFETLKKDTPIRRDSFKPILTSQQLDPYFVKARNGKHSVKAGHKFRLLSLIPSPPKLDSYHNETHLTNDSIAVVHKFRTETLIRSKKPIPPPPKLHRHFEGTHFIQDPAKDYHTFRKTSFIPFPKQIPPPPKIDPQFDKTHFIKMIQSGKQIPRPPKLDPQLGEANLIEPERVYHKLKNDSLIQRENLIPPSPKTDPYLEETRLIKDSMTADHKFRKSTLTKSGKQIPHPFKLDPQLRKANLIEQETVDHKFRRDFLIQKERHILPLNNLVKSSATDDHRSDLIKKTQKQTLPWKQKTNENVIMGKIINKSLYMKPHQLVTSLDTHQKKKHFLEANSKSTKLSQTFLKKQTVPFKHKEQLSGVPMKDKFIHNDSKEFHLKEPSKYQKIFKQQVRGKIDITPYRIKLKRLKGHIPRPPELDLQGLKNLEAANHSPKIPPPPPIDTLHGKAHLGITNDFQAGNGPLMHSGKLSPAHLLPNEISHNIEKSMLPLPETLNLDSRFHTNSDNIIAIHQNEVSSDQFTVPNTIGPFFNFHHVNLGRYSASNSVDNIMDGQQRHEVYPQNDPENNDQQAANKMPIFPNIIGSAEPPMDLHPIYFDHELSPEFIAAANIIVDPVLDPSTVQQVFQEPSTQEQRPLNALQPGALVQKPFDTVIQQPKPLHLDIPPSKSLPEGEPLTNIPPSKPLPVDVSPPKALPADIVPPNALPVDGPPPNLSAETFLPTGVSHTKPLPADLSQFKLKPTDVPPPKLSPTDVLPSTMADISPTKPLPTGLPQLKLKTVDATPPNLSPKDVLPAMPVDVPPPNHIPTDVPPLKTSPAKMHSSLKQITGVSPLKPDATDSLISEKPLPSKSIQSGLDVVKFGVIPLTSLEKLMSLHTNPPSKSIEPIKTKKLSVSLVQSGDILAGKLQQFGPGTTPAKDQRTPSPQNPKLLAESTALAESKPFSAPPGAIHETANIITVPFANSPEEHHPPTQSLSNSIDSVLVPSPGVPPLPLHPQLTYPYYPTESKQGHQQHVPITATGPDQESIIYTGIGSHAPRRPAHVPLTPFHHHDNALASKLPLPVTHAPDAKIPGFDVANLPNIPQQHSPMVIHTGVAKKHLNAKHKLQPKLKYETESTNFGAFDRTNMFDTYSTLSLGDPMFSFLPKSNQIVAKERKLLSKSTKSLTKDYINALETLINTGEKLLKAFKDTKPKARVGGRDIAFKHKANGLLSTQSTKKQELNWKKKYVGELKVQSPGLWHAGKPQLGR